MFFICKRTNRIRLALFYDKNVLGALALPLTISWMSLYLQCTLQVTRLLQQNLNSEEIFLLQPNCRAISDIIFWQELWIFSATVRSLTRTLTLFYYFDGIVVMITSGKTQKRREPDQLPFPLRLKLPVYVRKAIVLSNTTTWF